MHGKNFRWMPLSGNSKKSRRLKLSSCGFPPCFFCLVLWGFCSGLNFSASVITNFMKSSGSDSPVTRILDSPCDSFLNSEYLTYKLPLHDGPFPAVSWSLSTKRTVNWDTKGSMMMTIPFLTLPACSKKTIESLCSGLGLNDMLSFLEFRLLLMTQRSLCSWNFLIFHAVLFSFLSSRTLKMALPGQSDY